MESKISIAVGDNHKPVIKVIEKQSEDVRDDLVRNFRHLLLHKSKTLTIDFHPSHDGISATYNISPVEDEFLYFRERIYQMRFGNNENNSGEDIDKFNMVFDAIKDSISETT